MYYQQPITPILGGYGLAPGTIREGGVLLEKLCGGQCGKLPETLTLFETNICGFPFPISDLTLKSISA